MILPARTNIPAMSGYSDQNPGYDRFAQALGLKLVDDQLPAEPEPEDLEQWDSAFDLSQH
jgi:hypothetical protein